MAQKLFWEVDEICGKDSDGTIVIPGTRMTLNCDYFEEQENPDQVSDTSRLDEMCFGK